MIHYCDFVCKQKTAYEMRSSDWSSDVCTSDLDRRLAAFAHDVYRHRPMELTPDAARVKRRKQCPRVAIAHIAFPMRRPVQPGQQIGRASCRERVCQYV